jgi:(S)-mandelate dehydrogenase
MAGAGGLPRFETIVAEMKGDPDARATAAFFLSERDWNVGWDAIGNLRRLWSGPLLLKGLLDVGEARRAADLGVDGIVLSNHGGRNLDGVVAPIDVLPGVADAVGHRLSVLIDSGIRRGTDVVKALSLGAKAVLLGRPVAWGLAAGGEAGVSRALSIMREEIDRALAFLGCAHAEDLRPFYVCRSDRPNVEEREEAAAGTR